MSSWRIISRERLARLFFIVSQPFLALSLYAQKAFEEVDSFEFKPTLKSPMDTLAALTDFGKEINQVYSVTAYITIFVFFAVAIPLCYTLYKFRARPGDDSPPKQVHGNTFLEFCWTIIPVVLLIFIAVPTVRVILSQGKAAPDNAMKVTVIGHQWWWEFQYPDLNITTANELHLPENTPVEFTVTSADVIHSYWIPMFNGKIDAMPGRNNRQVFTTPALKNPEKQGGEYYRGHCAELCGSSHALMRFLAVVHSQKGFDLWAKTHNQPPTIETALEQKGSEIFNAQCTACHAINGTPSEMPGVPKIGPNLSNFGSRIELGAGTRPNVQKHLRQWIAEPEQIKPGSLMPGLGLSDKDIDAVSAYVRNSTMKPIGPYSRTSGG